MSYICLCPNHMRFSYAVYERILHLSHCTISASVHTLEHSQFNYSLPKEERAIPNRHCINQRCSDDT